MATGTISNYASNHFPCHGVYTSTAVSMSSGSLGWVMGWDPQYSVYYAQGVPITIPASRVGTCTSITVKVDYHSYNNINYSAGKKYHVCVLGTKYDTKATSKAQYNNIKGTSHATFTTQQGNVGAQSNTVTLSGLSLTPGTTYYVYVHYASQGGNSSLFVCDNITVTYTYYTLRYNANGYGTAPSTQYKLPGATLTVANFISPGTTLVKQATWNTNSSGTGTNYGARSSYTADASATLYAIWKPNGLVRIYDGSKWREAIPYIYNGSAWKQAIPYVYNGSAWKQGG